MEVDLEARGFKNFAIYEPDEDMALLYAKGACAGLGSEGLNFFPDKSDPQREQKWQCLSQCTVTYECLVAAFVHSEKFGIWGGANPRDRVKIWKLAPGIKNKRARAEEVAYRFLESQEEKYGFELPTDLRRILEERSK